MNIFEIAEKYNIGITKIKRMQRDGVLICDQGDGHPLAVAMRDNLRNQQDLSVLQMLALIDDPRVIAELRGRQGQARTQLEALGDYKSEAMPLVMVNSVRHAAENNPQSVKEVIAWVKTVLPTGGVPYAFLGVRVAFNLLPVGRPEFLKNFAQAMMFARKDPDFEGWHRAEQKGARKKTIYFRPAHIPLDL